MATARFARAGNAVLGAWLFVSAFVLPRSIEGATSAGLVGSVVLSVAIAAFYTHPRLHYVNAAAALWMLVSTRLLPPGSRGTLIHDAVLAALILGLALIPSGRVRVAGPAPV